MKVMMVPHPRGKDAQNGIGGISTVLRAYAEVLPKYGVTFVDTEAEADLVAVHAGAYYPADPTKPVVAMCHGLYFTGDYVAESLEYEMNAAVMDVLRRADEIIVPSEWVAETMRRDLRVDPNVIGHGIDADKWKATTRKGYVLWNKNRPTDACSPEAVNELAQRFPQQLFLTTFSDPNPTPNIKTTGPVLFHQMKAMLEGASVYLSSTKETFGIGILEALACGVPVLGFDQGGIKDIVQHKINGYLARPDDYDDLAVGLEYCLDYGLSMSGKAIERAKEFTWDAVAQKIVEVYKRAVMPKVEGGKTTVVIPCYNYGSKLTRAVQSVLKQTKKVTEIIIVDNNSTDNTKEVALSLAKKHPTVSYMNCPEQGVAHARNEGIKWASSEYVCCLDADDMIEPSFISKCTEALDADPTLGLAYTGLRWIMPDGKQGVSAWPPDYDYDLMLAGKNCVPTCCVMRRKMLNRLGGYRQRYAPEGAGAEDAELWLRAGAYGWGGIKASDAPLFVYSQGSGYVSGNPDYHEEDWRAWHPWVKDKSYPFASRATPEFKSHHVFQYDNPLVSVVIPCAPSHMKYLVDALDSVEAQNFRLWEIIVVYDTPSILDHITSYYELAYPHVRFMFNDGDKSGAGAARNIGAKASKAPYLLFLDADDWLVPSALETLLEAARKRAIVYSDYFGHAVMDEAEAQRLDGVQRLVEYRRSTSTAIVKHFAADFERTLAVRQPEMDQSGNFYLWNLITSLVPTAWHNQIGGFDETMESWEDWDYWLRFARAGADFVRVQKPLVHYRFTTGNRREVGIKLAPQLLTYLAEKAKGPHLMCCGSAPQQPVYTPPPPLSIQQGVPRNVTAEDYQMIELVDRNIGQHSIRGPVTKLDYGYRTHGDTFLMHVKDIEVLPSKEGHPRQVIRLQPAFNLVPNNERSENENLDRTDVLPDNEPIDNEEPPIFIDGVPSLESVAYLTPKQRDTLNKQGVYTVVDAIKLGVDELTKLKGITPKRVSLTLDECTRLLNKYG